MASATASKQALDIHDDDGKETIASPADEVVTFLSMVENEWWACSLSGAYSMECNVLCNTFIGKIIGSLPRLLSSAFVFSVFSVFFVFSVSSISSVFFSLSQLFPLQPDLLRMFVSLMSSGSKSLPLSSRPAGAFPFTPYFTRTGRF